MQLWQMDVMGGVGLEDGAELKVVTGVDDHSRFCVAAGLVQQGHVQGGVRGPGGLPRPLRHPR